MGSCENVLKLLAHGRGESSEIGCARTAHNISPAPILVIGPLALVGGVCRPFVSMATCVLGEGGTRVSYTTFSGSDLQCAESVILLARSKS
jgi:hypothetical protein